MKILFGILGECNTTHMTMDQQQNKRMNSSESGAQIRFLLSFYRPHAVKGIIALVIMLITASIGLIFPAMIGTMLDGFIHPEQSHGLDGEWHQDH